MKPGIRWCIVFFVLSGVGAATAEEPNVGIELTANDEDGIVAIGEEVTFSAEITNPTQTELDGNVQWIVHTVAFERPQTQTRSLSLAVGDKVIVTHSLTLPNEGFVDVECQVSDAATDRRVSRRLRIGAEPTRIKSRTTKAADFDSFWRDSLAELKDVAPRFRVSAKPELSNDFVTVFEASMRSVGNVIVRGWLEIPKRDLDSPLPVVIRVPGYGQNMRPIGRDDMIVFSFNTRAHGNSQDDVPGEPRDYWIRGLDDKNSYFYRGAYLDCVRAVDFVCSRKEVDPNHIAVWGGSQGGGFALATAALDSRIDYCVADIPFLCDWKNYFALTTWPEVDDWIDARDDRSWLNTLQTMSYFDTLNLAERIHCRTMMSVGLQDPVCPPETCFAVYNRIPATKDYRIYSDRGHWVGDDRRRWVWAMLRREFSRDKSITESDL